MNTKKKKFILLVAALNLVFLGAILTYFQFLGNKIVVEPPKMKVIVPKEDIQEGTKINKNMIAFKEVYEKDYEKGSIVDFKDILEHKSKIKLNKHMQIKEYMLQNPKEQMEKGYIKVSIDLENISNLVANQVQQFDYINLNLCTNQGKIGNVPPKIVLSKRKVLDLVDSTGVAKSKYTKSKEFKAQYIILDLPVKDYFKYKLASGVASKYGGNLELTLHDPTQPKFEENFEIDQVDQDIKDKVIKETNFIDSSFDKR